ncbi:MAG: HNH endonuclease, partial [Mycoplasmataceae bacterium]|nr:HNH endonuclease [Mycoplasmataceae bacterium]
LTNVYNYGIRTLIKEKKLSYCLLDQHPKPENAHIISKASLFKNKDEESLFKSADPFNCLRLSPSTHTSFDDNLITFTPDGKIIDVDGKVLINDPIHDILSSPQRMKYINENFEHWKQNKCNK